MNERRYKPRKMDASAARFVPLGAALEHHTRRVNLALAILGDECVGDASGLRSAFAVLDLAQQCDWVAGADEIRASHGYLIMRNCGISDVVMHAIDVLRQAKRTRH
jgi:hypothetical protein